MSITVLHHGGKTQDSGWNTIWGWILRSFSGRTRRIHRFHELESAWQAGDVRQGPAVILKGETESHGVLSAPSKEDPLWALDDGRRVKDRQIKRLDTARILDGYEG